VPRFVHNYRIKGYKVNTVWGLQNMLIFFFVVVVLLTLYEVTKEDSKIPCEIFAFQKACYTKKCLQFLMESISRGRMVICISTFFTLFLFSLKSVSDISVRRYTFHVLPYLAIPPSLPTFEPASSKCPSHAPFDPDHSP